MSHRHLTFSIPRRLRVYFRNHRGLLAGLSRCAWEATIEALRQELGLPEGMGSWHGLFAWGLFDDGVESGYRSAPHIPDTVIHDLFRLKVYPLTFIAELTQHIPDRHQKTSIAYGRYSNAHRGKRKKRAAAMAAGGAGGSATTVIQVQESEAERPSTTSKANWARLIKKIFEADPMLCPSCGIWVCSDRIRRSGMSAARPRARRAGEWVNRGGVVWLFFEKAR